MRRTRRNLIRAGLSGVTVGGLTGCLRLGSREDQGSPEDARFDADYENGTLRITYLGGGSLPAGQIKIRSKSGKNVTWNTLGSTAAGESETLSPNQTATLGPNVLNWQSEVSPGETVYVVYVAGDGSPTTLATFTAGSGTTTGSTTESGEGGDTSESSQGSTNTLNDGFEDGALSEYYGNIGNRPGWRIDESVALSGEYSARGVSTGYTMSIVRNGFSIKPERLQFAFRVRDKQRNSRGHIIWSDTAEPDRPWASPVAGIGWRFNWDDKTGLLWPNHGGKTLHPQDQLAVDTWYRVEIREIDYASQTAVVYLNDQRVGEADLPSGGPIESVLFHVDARTDHVVWFDQVSVGN